MCTARTYQTPRQRTCCDASGYSGAAGLPGRPSQTPRQRTCCDASGYSGAAGLPGRPSRSRGGGHAACPLSTRGGTRLVRLESAPEERRCEMQGPGARCCEMQSDNVACAAGAAARARVARRRSTAAGPCSVRGSFTWMPALGAIAPPHYNCHSTVPEPRGPRTRRDAAARATQPRPAPATLVGSEAGPTFPAVHGSPRRARRFPQCTDLSPSQSLLNRRVPRPPQVHTLPPGGAAAASPACSVC
jgi:hypothetical protein